MSRWFLGLVLLASIRPCGAEVLDSWVARVDTAIISWSEVLQEAGVRLLSGDSEGLAAPAIVRDALIRRRLLSAEALKLRLSVGAAEVRASVAELESKVGSEFWDRIERLGMGRRELERRAEVMLLVRRYLELRREMTFVPEAQVRAFYAEQQEVLGRPLAEVRDEVRGYLAERKYQRELDQWIDRQAKEGRVERIPFLNNVTD